MATSFCRSDIWPPTKGLRNDADFESSHSGTPPRSEEEKKKEENKPNSNVRNPETPPNKIGHAKLKSSRRLVVMSSLRRLD